MSHKLMRRLFAGDVHHVAGLHTILDRLMPAKGRVLDLGCGSNTDLAPYRTAEREVWGTDFAAHTQLSHPEWFRPLAANGAIPFPDESLDVVVAIMVMEHVAEPALFFQEVARVLRPGGHFVGHTISGSHYVTWLRRFIGLLPHGVSQWLVRRLYGRAEEDTFPAYYRLNRRTQLERACRQAGLSSGTIIRYADPGYFQFLEMLQAVAVVADWLLEQAAPGWGRLYMTFVTCKEDSAARAARRQAA